MAELSLAEKAIAALWLIESPTAQIRILKQNDKQFEPSTNFHPLRTDVLNLLFKIIIKTSCSGSEDASSRLDSALKALKIFATLVSSMEHPLQVYTVDVWSTKINFFIGSQIAENAEKAGKRLPVRSWLLTIVDHVYDAIFTEYQGISQASRLAHAAIISLLYAALFHQIDQSHGDPDVRRAIFKNVAKILVHYAAVGLSFPEVASNAVVKYGPKRIIEGCTDFLGSGFILGVAALITHLSQVPAAHDPIFVTGRFHVRLMEKYWAWTGNPVEDPEPVSAQSITYTTLTLVGTLISHSPLSESLRRAIITDLVAEQDLILLVGRSFVHFPVKTCSYAVMLAQIRKKIVQFSTNDVNCRTEQVNSPWFHVYQPVKIASRSELHQIPKVSPSHKCGPGCSSPKMVSAADWWLAFGAEIGFDIARIEVEYYEAALGVAAPNISLEGGCAWHRCSHHGEQASVMFLRCCNCKSAWYCSLGCQKRDWSEGNHKAVCKK